MMVLDASVVLEILLQLPGAERLERRVSRSEGALYAPQLLDVEVVQALRRYVARGECTAERGEAAVAVLRDFPMVRYPHQPLLTRIWALRDNCTAYDAAYVALAETLGAPLVTRDAGLAAAPGHRARIELL